MSRFRDGDLCFARCRYEDLPADRRVRIYGVPYARFGLEDGGEFYLTRYGLARFDHLRPEQWYLDERYAREGTRLPGGTSSVYRVPTHDRHGRRVDLVVRFSRFAQDVPLHVTGTFLKDVSAEDARHAAWNDPFEEVGMLMDLRRGRFGPPALHILTKRPLGIYCPPREFAPNQLGRSLNAFQQHDLMLARELQQGGLEPVVHLHPTRLYILVYEWIKGLDAEVLHDRGALGDGELQALTARVVDELRQKGFRVLDNKPRHFILRPQLDGTPLRRGDRLVYALVDFELLQRTAEHQAWLRQQPRRGQPGPG